jgi:cell division protease FtsH
MSQKLGAVKYGTGDAEPFMGRDYGHQRDYSEDIAADIDSEVRDLIEGAHDEAWEILVQYRDALDRMVLELVEKETLNKEDLERILAPVRKRPPHNTFTAFGKRTPSDRPPVDIPTSLRKTPNGSANGSANGHGDSPNGDSPNRDGKAMPGVVPEPAMPQPPTGQTAVFGPQPGGNGQPQYGQPSYGAPQNGQNGQNGQPPYGEAPTQPYRGYPPQGSGE